MKDKKAYFQIIWGILLLVAGVGVFVRVPQIMPTIKTIENFSDLTWFIRFCFYLIGILLIGGGARKIHYNYKLLAGHESRP